jgi:cytoskeletal protein CcmA (bactofilin family)
MWGKTTERDGAVLDAPRIQGTQERTQATVSPAPQTSKTTAIGKTMRLRGEMSSDEELYLDGDIEGTLEVRNRLTIGPNGKVKANVKARELVVRGSIQGNVEASERIFIMTGASIVGDVKTAGIVIEDGAYFKGGIDILAPEVKKTEAAASTAVVPEVGARAVGR